AIMNARFAVAVQLLDRGAEVTRADPHGTPLQLLSFVRRAPEAATDIIPRHLPEAGVDARALARALIDHGDDINARYRFPTPPKHVRFGTYLLGTFRGATPFFIAAIAADVPWMQFLAANGADPTIPTVSEISPLHAASGIACLQGSTPGTN